MSLIVFFTGYCIRSFGALAQEGIGRVHCCLFVSFTRTSVLVRLSYYQLLNCFVSCLLNFHLLTARLASPWMRLRRLHSIRLAPRRTMAPVHLRKWLRLGSQEEKLRKHRSLYRFDDQGKPIPRRRTRQPRPNRQSESTHQWLPRHPEAQVDSNAQSPIRENAAYHLGTTPARLAGMPT